MVRLLGPDLAVALTMTSRCLLAAAVPAAAMIGPASPRTACGGDGCYTARHEPGPLAPALRSTASRRRATGCCCWLMP